MTFPASFPAACLALLLGAGCGVSAARPAERPSVVWIVADDLGFGDVGFHGAEFPTPNLDALASESVELTSFYVQPTCTPTRAGLLTGRSPMRLGLQYSVIRPWSDHGVPRDAPLLSEILGELGYRTAAIGKWHLGHRRSEFRPLERGFDHFYGHLTSVVDYFTHEYAGTRDWQRDGESLDEEGYATELIADEAVRFLNEQEAEQPFFLYLPFGAPHAPLQAPPERVARLAHIEDEDRRTFAAMVGSLDDAVGRVLAALDERGLRENTIVFFCSDNGGDPSLGARNARLRGGKGTTFEGGIRVPALLSYPAELEGGARVDETVSHLDLFPTIARLCGAELPDALDGHDAWPVITGEESSRHDELFFAVEHRKWSETAVRTREWKLVREYRPRWENPTDHLFRVAEDPGEETNLAAEHPDVVRELARRIDEWRAGHPAGGLVYSHQPPEGFLVPEDWAEID